MSFIDNSENRANSKHEVGTSSLMPGLVMQHSPVEQLPFPDSSPGPQVAQQYQAATALSMARPLDGPTTSPGVTRDWPVVQTGALTVAGRNTTALRSPVIIRGSGKKSSGIMRPPKGKKQVVHIAAAALLAFVILGTLIAVIPAGNQAGASGGFNILKPLMDIVNTKGNNTAGLIAAQAATATAVTQDGYDPGAKVYPGVPAAPPGSGGGGLNRFFYGQCTYWANMRYHALTGVWVPWLGNANQWYAGALNYGWNTSTAPKLHSIIVLQAGVQGAGYYGHVAIVEQINSDGSVVTSDYNWAGNWAVETFVTFRPGSGVDFVWAPGF